LTDTAETLGVVYVVDDDDAVRDSLHWLLEASRYRVIGYDSAEKFLADYDPDSIAVAILDVRMPGMSGLELQEALLARKATLPIIFITGHGDVPMAVTTMKKGAVDFIEKPFDQAALKALVERMLAEARARASELERQRLGEALLSRLTPREQQVLERIVAGRLNKQIADDLGISIKTVEAHRANIMDKMNANTVADLMRTVLAGGGLR
jgi:two-component system, LuxR family, response regulator TtrR